MRFVQHLRELSRLRAGVAASAVLALLAAVWSVAQIGLIPPKLTPRSQEMATAFTQVVVDTPNSAIFDLRQRTDDILPLKNRATLLGNLMASPPVRAYIADRAGVPADVLQVATPRTPAQPRARAAPGEGKGPADILRSTDQYRLDIQSNPTVPFLDIYAQAPTALAAEELANAGVDGLEDYLHDVAAMQKTPAEQQVRLRQLGRAQGEVINDGIQLQVALALFFLVFAASCAAAVVVARVHRDWNMSARASSY